MPFTALALAHAGAIALEHYRRQVDDERAACARREARRAIQLAAPVTPTSSKCPCCGARDWVVHDGASVCSYCRNERDGQPVVASAVKTGAPYPWAAMHSGYAITRRELLAGLSVK